MSNWTVDQVDTMAPDAASIKAGRKLGKAAKWQTLGRNEHALWGEFKGSGSNPYQTCIELAEPAFKCSCPSRKFPCKHALGLAYVYAEESAALKNGQAPAWVSEWFDKRQQRAEKKAAKAEAKPKDEATLKRQQKAKQKRAASRQEKIDAGVAELQLWLQDLVRQGLANDQADWDKMSARMVDAQAPGLARWLLRCGDLPYQLDHWQEPMLFQISRLYLLLKAYQGKDQLSPLLVEDIQNLIGYTKTKDELFEKETPVDDSWVVVGQLSETDAQLQMQRTWLWGKQSKRYALILDFAVMNQVLPMRPGVGQGFEGALVFYPGTLPFRALVKEESEQFQQSNFEPDSVPVKTAMDRAAEALASYPWLEGLPLTLNQVVPVHEQGQWHLVDSEKQALKIFCNEQTAWTLLSLSAGHSINIFGELSGTTFSPISLASKSGFVNLMSFNMELAG